AAARREWETRRGHPVRRDADAELERLAGEKLHAVRAPVPDERGVRDRRLTGPPLTQGDPALRRGRVIGEGSSIAHDGLSRRPVEGDTSSFEEDRPLAKTLDRRSGGGDEHDRPALLLEREDPSEALSLERLIADGEDLVQQEDVGVEERRDCEPEPHPHP